MNHRLAILNQKGGVGKTTTSANLGAALALMGFKVLVVDLDPQSHLTLHLGGDPNLKDLSIARVLRGEKPLKDSLQTTSTPGLDLCPASVDLAACELALDEEVARESILRGVMEAAREGGLRYDLVLFDCPPSLGVLTLNALVAATGVLVPLQAEFFSLQGYSRLHELVALVRRRLNPILQVRGVLPCLVDSRRSLTAEVVQELRRHLGDRLLQTRIRISVRLAEAPGFGRTIFQHAPRSHGAEDYRQLAYELSARLGLALERSRLPTDTFLEQPEG